MDLFQGQFGLGLYGMPPFLSICCLNALSVCHPLTSTAIQFKEGMHVECYVNSEDAFLDTSNLREVEKGLD